MAMVIMPLMLSLIYYRRCNYIGGVMGGAVTAGIAVSENIRAMDMLLLWPSVFFAAVTVAAGAIAILSANKLPR